jgi:peroxiredoxin
MQDQRQRRRVGDLLPAFELETLAHGPLSVPSSGLIHLQFRRFAGCPVCNVQLRRFAQAHAELAAAGVLTVSFFYSTREAMLDYQHELPHPIVADPQRRWFSAFGVERSLWATAHPRTWATAIGGLLSGPTNPFEGGAQDGLPADFLIVGNVESEAEVQCQIVALHYGVAADDQWSVDEVLELARAHDRGQVPSAGTGRLVTLQAEGL